MYRSLFISLILVGFMYSCAQAQMVIVVNKNNPITHISPFQLKKIYNGNYKLWDNGTRIIPVDYPETDPLTINFSEIIVRVDIETRHMAQMQKLFAGVGAPPRTEKNCAAVISFVASEPGAIGYVTKESVNSSVKVILVDGKSEF